jgi:hypothetical protein
MTPADTIVAEAHADRAPLGPLERRVIGAIGARGNVGEVARELSLTLVELSAICTRLMELELIAIVPAGAEDDTAQIDDAWDAPQDTARATATPTTPPPRP